MIFNLAVSPDGRALAFTVPKQATSILVIPTAGGEPRQVFQARMGELPVANYSGLAWTPDGRQLLFVRQRVPILQDNRELWAIAAEGGEPRPLGLAMTDLRALRIHPDGNRIAVAAGRDVFEVWALEIGRAHV